MKDKNNIVKIVIMVIGIILVCALCFFASESSSSKNGDNYSQTNNSSAGSADQITTEAQEESANVAADEKKDFENISMDNYLEMYKGSENKLVLFSRPTCSYCQIAEPILQNIAYRYDLTIYHLNTDDFSSDDEEKLVTSDDYFNQGFGTPLLVVVSNKEIVDSVSGLTNTKNYEEFFSKHGFIK